MLSNYMNCFNRQMHGHFSESYETLLESQNCCRPSCPWPPCPQSEPCRPCSGNVSFSITKRDRITNQRLAGAVYGLFKDCKLVQKSRSDCRGELKFRNICRGTYELRELEAPDGYQTDTTIYILIVHKNGFVEIDGQPLPVFVLYDLPEHGFYFYKTDANTGLSVPGAIFALDTGLSAESDSDGLVYFGILAPGNYALAEIRTPDGYLPNNHVYTVVVSPDGCITVDGIDYREFTIENFPILT